MRWSWLAAFAFVVAAPAEADVTARFLQNEGPPMVVAVRDNGDSRIVVTDAVYLMTAGERYMVLTDAAGSFVARQDDFLSLMAELLAAAGPLGQSSPPAAVTITESGSETVGGRTGTVLRVGDAANDRDRIEAVINSDPDLAPVGRSMAVQLTPFFAVMTRNAPGVGEAFRELLGRGAVLRFGEMWRLDSVDSAPIAADTFALPSTPLTRAQLEERLGARVP